MTESSPSRFKSISTAVSRRKPLTPPPPSKKSSRSGAGAGDKEGDASDATAKLKRTLGVTDLIFYGIGCSVGAGIYSLVGIGARLTDGPAISVSFALCGIACCFTALSYAEFASRVPLAGSAYTFAYVSFGELIGWLVGWNLTLGYAVSAAAVARSWAVYVSGFLQGLAALRNNEFLNKLISWSASAPLLAGGTATCCPLAAIVIMLCTFVLITGAKESSRFNSIMTCMNLFVLLFVVVTGWTMHSVNVDDNWFHENENDGVPSFFGDAGWDGVGKAAGLVFFSYLGFDMVSCLSEEVIDPSKNMPIGIVGSLVASTIIYCVVSLTVVGMAPVKLLGDNVPVVNAMLANACCSHDQQLLDDGDNDGNYQCLSYSSCEATSSTSSSKFVFTLLYVGSKIVSIGAMFGLTTATFACLMGQPRIFYSMSQDGLLFEMYGKISEKAGVPIEGTIVTGILTAMVACFVDLEYLANAISLGTLQVFTFVNAGILILRTTPPIAAASATTATADDNNELLVNEQTALIAQVGDNNDAHHHHHHHNPLIPDQGGANLVKRLSTLEDLQTSVRVVHRHHHLHRHSGTGVVHDHPHEHHDDEEHTHDYHLLEANGSKPHWYILAYTITAILLSMGFSRGWSYLWTLTPLALVWIASTVGIFGLHRSAPPLSDDNDKTTTTTTGSSNGSGGGSSPAAAGTYFACPYVPAVPLLGIFCNSYMMGSLPYSTWLVIFVWLFLGVCFYFSYGIHHSELRQK